MNQVDMVFMKVWKTEGRKKSMILLSSEDEDDPGPDVRRGALSQPSACWTWTDVFLCIQT